MDFKTQLFPIALSGLLLSAAQPAFARPDFDAPRLERLNNRLERLGNREFRNEAKIERLNQHIQQVNQPSPPSNFQNQLPQLNQVPQLPRLDNQIRRSMQLDSKSRWRGLAGNLDLDLTSTQTTITLGAELFSDVDSASIKVGGVEKLLQAGAQVTPAELVALTQVLDSGKQSLLLSSSGNAVEGSFSLSTISDATNKLKASSLVVPTEVTALGNFGKSGELQIRDELVNFGSIIATGKQSGKVSFAADTIINQENALIASVTPKNSNARIDLSFDAKRDFVNEGTILSSGTINVSAGNSILNSGASSELVANGDITLTSNQQRNDGIISSLGGNINVLADNSASLTVENKGNIVAQNGAINIRNPDFQEKLDTTISGGNWLSNEFNINGGEGILNVNANNITGAVDARAGIAHIFADSPDLYIRNLEASGDPTITTTGHLTQGSISTGGGPLTIIAGGNITFTSGAVLSTDNVGGTAGDITIVAGAQFENASDPDHIGQVWLLGATGSGGAMFDSGPVTISANGDTAGNVQLIAFPQVGSITLDTTTIEAKGAVGNNGNVTAIAANGVQFQSVDTHGITSGTGDVGLYALRPNIVGGKVVVDDATGAIISGSFTPNTSLTQASAVIVSTLNSGNDAIVRTGTASAGSIKITNLTADFFQGVTGGGLTLIPNADINTLSFNATGDLTLSNSGDLVIQTLALTGINISDGIVSTTGTLTTLGNLVSNNLDLTGGALALGGTVTVRNSLALTATNSDLNVDKNVRSDYVLKLTSTTGSINLDAEARGLFFTFTAANDINISGVVSTTAATGVSTLSLTTDGNLLSDGITGTLNVSAITLKSINGSVGQGKANPFVVSVPGFPTLGVPGKITASAPLGVSIATPDAAITFGNVTSSDVYLKGAGTVDVDGTISGDNVKVVSTGGNIQVDGNISSPNSLNTIVLDSNTGSVTVASNLAASQVTINAATAINVSGAIGYQSGTPAILTLLTTGNLIDDGLTGTFDVATLNLISTNGNIGTDATNRFEFLGLHGASGDGTISANALQGSAWITLPDAGASIAASTVRDTLDVIVNGQLNVAGATTIESTEGDIKLSSTEAFNTAAGSLIKAPGTVNLSTQPGIGSAFQVDGSIEASRLEVALDQLAGVSSIAHSDVRVIAATGSGDLTVGDNAGDVTVESIMSGDTSITSSGTLSTVSNLSGDSIIFRAGEFNLGGSLTAANYLELEDTSGDFTLASNVQAPTVTLKALNALTVNANLTAPAAGSTLNVFASSLSANALNGTTNFSNVNLTAGSIGTSASNRLLLQNVPFTGTTPTNLSINTTSGSAFVETTGAVLLNNSTTQNALDLFSQAGVLIGENQAISTLNGDLKIVASKDAFEVGQGSTVSAQEGNIYLQNLAQNGRRRTYFAIRDNATISAFATTAGAGNVTLALGQIPSNQPKGKNFNKNTITATETAGGNITWGSKKWIADVGPITVTAKGANVVFANALTKKATIGANVQIIADPPTESFVWAN